MIHYKCSLPTDPVSDGVIRHLREQGLICADHQLRRKDEIITSLLEKEIDAVKAAGIEIRILEDETVTDGPTADSITTGYVDHYMDSAGIEAAFAALHMQFPALTGFTDLPESTTGYDGAHAGITGPSPVKLFRISTTPGITSKPAVLIVAGLHAREWAPPLAAVEFAAQLLHNYDPASADPDVIKINELVDSLDILIVGAGNPDGIDFSHYDDNWWRKNRRPNAGLPSCPGVDNNRNFSIYWGEGGSSPDPCDYQLYHGPAPFSEAENRNIRYIVEHYPNILTAIDCHSYGEDFLRPQPGGGSYISAEPVPAADDAIYHALETAMNAAVATVSPGKTYSTGTTSNHAGTFDEYMYFGHRIFAFELEIGQDFQPPIADGLGSVQEAAAIMRAVAKETIGLASRFITPAAIVQVIDRSGSMISSGYTEPTRSNAKRLVDLMSLNDQTAIVSFNSTASTEQPLTTLVDTSGYAAARSAIDGITFGGNTSIGAGLERAIGILPSPGIKRSILLLSDGYENSPPMVSEILPTVPADVQVHTIALGMASDQTLLQHIAAATGGTYFFSPDELELFSIYNAARGTVADSDMVADSVVTLPGSDIGKRVHTITRRIVIECGADYADFSVAAHQGAQAAIDVSLRCLSVPQADLGRVERRTGPGYINLRLKRPQAGIYQLEISAISQIPVTCNVSAWVSSPLRLRLSAFPKKIVAGRPIDLGFSLSDNGKPVKRVSVSAISHVPSTSVKMLAKQWRQGTGTIIDRITDAHHKEVLQAIAVRGDINRKTGNDPFSYTSRPAQMIHPRLLGKETDPERMIAIRSATARSIEGTYNLRCVLQGYTNTGCPFTRVAIHSCLVTAD